MTRAPPRSAISPAAATSQADRPPCWTNASNRPLPTYARASAAEPIERGIRICLRTLRERVAAARPLSAIEITKSDSLSLTDAWIGPPVEDRRAVGRRAERLVAGRIDDHPDRRHAVGDEPDRDAEDRDPVGVVHRPVERVDDPDAAAARRRCLTGDRAVLAGLLGEDRVARVPVVDRARRSAPRTGDRPRSRRRGRSCSRSARAARSGPSGRRRPGRPGPWRTRARPRQPVTACCIPPSAGRTADPSSSTCRVNVTVWPGEIGGLRIRAPRPPLRSAGSWTRQVVWPAPVPVLVTWSVIASPLPSGVAPLTLEVNGPTPDTASRATIARRMTATATPPMAMPWTCDADESLAVRAGCSARTSPTSIGTGAPHRTHGWVSSGAAVVGAVTAVMVPRTAPWGRGASMTRLTSGRPPTRARRCRP